jgi:hypothetical protein
MYKPHYNDKFIININIMITVFVDLTIFVLVSVLVQGVIFPSPREHQIVFCSVR